MKKVISILLVLTVICSTLVFTVLTANGTDVEIASVGVDDYPYRGSTTSVVDQWNFYSLNCTSFCAWRLNNNNGVDFHNHYGGVQWGNAKNWDDAASSLDIPVNNTPAVGSIACWNRGTYGHVAWVSNVNSDGTIDIEEYNYGGRYQYGTRHLSASDPDDFIHIKDINHENKPEPLNIGDDFYAMIINTKCWKPISLVEGSDRVFLKNENGKSRELWHFIRQEDGAYVIFSCYNGKALEMHNGEREVCTQLSAHDDYWGGYYQQWYIYAQGDGYVLKSKHYSDEDWVMDLYAADPTDGNVIQINHRNNSTAQVWSIYKDVYRNIGDNFNATICNAKYQNYVSKVDGTNNIYLQEKNNTAKQLWHFEKQDDCAYVITSCYDNKALEMTNGTREEGTQISAFDNYWGGYYQQWYFLPFGDGYKLLSKHYTSERWFLDRSARTTENGNIVQIYKNYGFDDQVWCINKNDEYADLGNEFNATITNAKYQNYVSKVDGTNNIFLQDKNNTAKQLWHFTRQSDGAYAITSCYDNKALEMTNGTRDNGTQITAHDTYWEGYYQQWYLLPLGDGYKLLSKHYTSERWFLDRSAQTTDNGNIVQIYGDYDNDDQVFQIEKYSGEIPAADILGDVNGDDDVDSVDATIIQRVCTMIKVPFTEEQLMCGDVDGDGSLTTVDATFIQRYSTRITTPYHIGEVITQ